MQSLLRRPLPHVTTMFTGIKTSSPIPVTSALLGEFLVDAHLDPAVRRLDRVPELLIDGVVRLAQAAVVDFGPSRCVIEVLGNEADSLGAVAATTLRLPKLSVTGDQLALEPRATNRRVVWASRRHPVSAHDRIKILATLTVEGGEMSLAELGENLGASDPLAAILRLVCDDQAEADLSSALIGPNTRIRLRRAEQGGRA